MQFSLTDKPPEGWKKYITPAVYAAFDGEHQYRYEPEWREYRTRKVRDYSECDCCGNRQFLGWVEEQTPIGEPYRYVYRAPFMPYNLMRSMQAAQVEAINKSNVLTARILKRHNGKLTDPKYS